MEGAILMLGALYLYIYIFKDIWVNTNILGYQPPGGYQNWVFTQMLVLVLVP